MTDGDLLGWADALVRDDLATLEWGTRRDFLERKMEVVTASFRDGPEIVAMGYSRHDALHWLFAAAKRERT